MNCVYKFVKDVLTDDVTGKYSSTKIWYHIANFAATYCFVKLEDNSAELWLVYLGAVGGFNLSSAWLKHKYSAVTKEKEVADATDSK